MFIARWKTTFKYTVLKMFKFFDNRYKHFFFLAVKINLFEFFNPPVLICENFNVSFATRGIACYLGGDFYSQKWLENYTRIDNRYLQVAILELFYKGLSSVAFRPGNDSKLIGFSMTDFNSWCWAVVFLLLLLLPIVITSRLHVHYRDESLVCCDSFCVVCKYWRKLELIASSNTPISYK